MSEKLARTALKALATTNFPSSTGAISAADLREWAEAVSESARLILEADDADYIVINMTTTTPPGSPTDGDAYVVAASATGAWSGQDDAIAIWDADESPPAWNFVTPIDQMTVRNQADETTYVWDADASPPAWVAQSGVGATSLNALSDVDTATNGVVAKDVLVYDGSNFVPRQSNVIGLHAVIADDAVATLTLPGNVQAGILTVAGFQASSASGIFRFNATSAELYITALVNSGTQSLLTATSVLAGTTGTDGRVTVSVNNGTVYVENRSGGATRLDICVMQNQSF